LSIVSLSGLVFVIFFGVPQTDVLECETKLGDRYILKSKYIWTPLNPNPVHSSVRNSQGDYSVFFKRKKSDRWKNANATIQYIQIDAPDSAESLCSQVGVKNGTPILFQSFMNMQGYWYDWPHGFPDKLYTYDVNGTIPYIKQQLINVKGTPGDFREARVMEFNKQLIFELPITDNRVIVKAVLTSFSNDNGGTWSKLKLNRTPVIFEVEKKIYEQSYVARPVEINDEKVIEGGDRRSRGSLNGYRQKQLLD